MDIFTKPVEQYQRQYDTLNVAMGDLVECLKVSKGWAIQQQLTM